MGAAWEPVQYTDSNRATKQMKKCGFLFLSMTLGLPLCMPPVLADQYPRQPGVDAQHYIFRLTLRDDTDEISGEAEANAGEVSNR